MKKIICLPFLFCLTMQINAVDNAPQQEGAGQAGQGASQSMWRQIFTDDVISGGAQLLGATLSAIAQRLDGEGDEQGNQQDQNANVQNNQQGQNVENNSPAHEEPTTDALYNAIIGRDLAKVFALCGKVDVNELVQKGVGRLTPLMIACRMGNTQIVNSLLDAGADVQRINSDRESALVFAVRGGFYDIVQMLVNKSADVTVRSSDGKSLIELTTSLPIWNILKEPMTKARAAQEDMRREQARNERHERRDERRDHHYPRDRYSERHHSRYERYADPHRRAR